MRMLTQLMTDHCGAIEYILMNMPAVLLIILVLVYNISVTRSEPGDRTPPQQPYVLVTCPLTKDLNQTKDAFRIISANDDQSDVLTCDWLAQDPHNADCTSLYDFSLVTITRDQVVVKGPQTLQDRDGLYTLKLIPPDKDLPFTPCLRHIFDGTKTHPTSVTPVKPTSNQRNSTEIQPTNPIPVTPANNHSVATSASRVVLIIVIIVVPVNVAVVVCLYKSRCSNDTPKNQDSVEPQRLMDHYKGLTSTPRAPAPSPIDSTLTDNPQELYPSDDSTRAMSTPDVTGPRYLHCKEELRFLLLGKTGSGKSTTGNTILGAEKFSVAMSFESVTDECELRDNIHLGRRVQIMDSPGLFDTRRSHEDISVDIVKAVAGMHPGPHAILYVIPMGRYTEQEYAVYNRLKALFDDHLTKYLVVLFTFGDQLPPGQTMEQLLQREPEWLSKVLGECDRRYILFNNKAADPTPQVQKLFDLVTDMNRRNEGQPYNCPKYEAVGQTLEQEVARRLAEAEKREVERTRYVQELKEQTDQAHKAMETERQQFQEREKKREAEMKLQEKKREKRMSEMTKLMEKQQLSLEQQREEERKLRDTMEEERKAQHKAMEEQRKREKQEMAKLEEKFQNMMKAQQEESRRQMEEQTRQYNETLQEMQRQVAKASKESRGGFVEQLLGVAAGIASVVLPIKFFS